MYMYSLKTYYYYEPASFSAVCINDNYVTAYKATCKIEINLVKQEKLSYPRQLVVFGGGLKLISLNHKTF